MQLDLSKVPTDLLQTELKRRQKQLKQQVEAEMRAREVVIICPACEGRCRIDFYGLDGKVVESIDCLACKDGKRVAYRK